jgi:hypothetical protein
MSKRFIIHTRRLTVAALQVELQLGRAILRGQTEDGWQEIEVYTEIRAEDWWEGFKAAAQLLDREAVITQE